jgi:hypothetical protein
MQINIQFDTLAEMFEFAEKLRPIAEIHVGDIHVRGSDALVGSMIADEAFTTAAEAEHDDGVTDPGPLPGKVEHVAVEQAAAPVTRKRRTKAEIAADKAAKLADPVVAHPTHSEPRINVVHNPLDNLKAEPGTPVESTDGDSWAWARPDVQAQAALFDGTDKLAHMNEAREFIAKHGFPSYNDTMAIAGTPPNIAAYSPEQVALHRAAMAWRDAIKSKG